MAISMTPLKARLAAIAATAALTAAVFILPAKAPRAHLPPATQGTTC